MANSKRIGNKNENELKKWFSSWTGWEFHRVPASGGLHWAGDQGVHGDIIPPAQHKDEFPFCIETKTRRPKVSNKSKLVRDQINIGLLLIDWEDCHIMEFWNQCIDDAESIDKYPFMALRNNGMPKGCFYVFLYYKLALLLSNKFCLPFAHIPDLGISVTTTFELESVDPYELFKYTAR